jgi:hypothetical protein
VASVGTNVTIVGSNLTNASVSFGDGNASLVYNTSDEIIVSTPRRDSVGPVDLTVTTAWGSATSSNGFTYTKPDPPTITSVSANSVSVLDATWLSISGTSFSGVTGVSLGNSTLTLTNYNCSDIWSSKSLSVPLNTYCIGSDQIIYVKLGGNQPGAQDLTLTTPWN